MFFGWLEVGEIWRLWSGTCQTPDWASDHPHIGAIWGKNTLYTAAQTETGFQAGVFRSYSDQLVLTAPHMSRSHWRLPRWFYPPKGIRCLATIAIPTDGPATIITLI